MRLVLFELRKIRKSRMLLFVSLFLIAGNAAAFYEHENSRRNREAEWEEFTAWEEDTAEQESARSGQAGKDTAEQESARSGQAGEDTAAQGSTWTSQYQEFLDQIPAQAEQLKKGRLYQDHDSFLYRNLEKTVRDYAELDASNLTEDDAEGFLAYAGYSLGIYFVLAAVLLFAGVLILQEKKRGILLVTKSTEHGHVGLPLAKLAAMSLCVILFAVSVEAVTLALAVVREGAFPVGARIQSLSAFRDCSLSITMGQAVLLCVLARVLTALVAAHVLMLLLFLCSWDELGYVLYALVLILEFVLDRTLSVDGRWNGLKVVNLFSLTDPEELLGVYCNLNLFGYPAGKLETAAVSLSLGSVLCIALGCLAFSARMQITSESIFGKLAESVRRRGAFLWRQAGVFCFEFRKIFLHQHRWLAAAALAVYLAAGIRSAREPRLFSDLETAKYHALISEIAGPVTEESLIRLEEERKEVDEILEQRERAVRGGDADELYMLVTYFEIDYRARGLGRVEMQRDALLGSSVTNWQRQREVLPQKESFDGKYFADEESFEESFDGKYFVDEESYLREFSDVSDTVLRFVAAALLFVVMAACAESYDEDKGMKMLLRATFAGTKAVRAGKRRVLALAACAAYLCLIVPELLRLWQIDGFIALGHPLADFTTETFHSPLTLGTFLVLVFAVRAALFALFAAGVTVLGERLRRTSVVMGLGILIPVVGGLLFVLFDRNIPILLLR